MKLRIICIICICHTGRGAVGVGERRISPTLTWTQCTQSASRILFFRVREARQRAPSACAPSSLLKWPVRKIEHSVVVCFGARKAEFGGGPSFCKQPWARTNSEWKYEQVQLVYKTVSEHRTHKRSAAAHIQAALRAVLKLADRLLAVRTRLLELFHCTLDGLEPTTYFGDSFMNGAHQGPPPRSCLTIPARTFRTFGVPEEQPLAAAQCP